MPFEPLDVAKLIGLTGCVLSMAVIASILVRGYAGAALTE
jgi:hypothetical protein